MIRESEFSAFNSESSALISLFASFLAIVRPLLRSSTKVSFEQEKMGHLPVARKWMAERVVS